MLISNQTRLRFDVPFVAAMLTLEDDVKLFVVFSEILRPDSEYRFGKESVGLFVRLKEKRYLR